MPATLVPGLRRMPSGCQAKAAKPRRSHVLASGAARVGRRASLDSSSSSRLARCYWPWPASHSPAAEARHRALAEALQDRVLVRLDVAKGPEVEGLEHRVAVLFAEHRTDITLEAQPSG